MENQPATNSSRSPLACLWPWLFVLMVLVFVGFIRVRLLDMPLERDEGEYAYAGQLILQGVPPYELAYNMKLPGTYFIYALGMAVFGETTAGVHLTLLVANALTIIFVFLLARKLFGTMAGLVACASYGIMSVSVPVLGTAAHATQFVVLFAVPATLLLLQADENKRRRTMFFSGLLYGLAFLMIQQGICFCLFGCFFLVWRAVANKSILTITFAKNGLIFGLGTILPFSLFCLSCIVAGDFDRFWFWTFVYAHKYATMMPWSEGSQNLTGHLQQTRTLSLGLCLLAMAGLPPAWLNRATRQQALFAVAFWLFSFLGAAIGLYFRPHYFILVLPAFAILIGMSAESLRRVLDFGRMRNVLQTLPLILFATILSWAIFYQARSFFQASPLDVCRTIYPRNPFIESRIAADYIHGHSTADSRIAVVGSEPEIYFYSQRHSATGYIYTYPMMEPQPAALAMQREMMREIETNRPEYLVFVPYQLSWLAKPYSNRSIFDWFDQYAGRFYKVAGFVGYNNQGELVSGWDEASTNVPPITEEYVRVYKREPAPAPIKTN